MNRAAIFDLDGTLAATPAAIARLLVRVTAEAGFEVTPQQVAPTIGKPLEPSVARLIGRPVEDSATVHTVARYRELFDREVLALGPDLLYPGVADGLRALGEQGFGLAVATSKISASAEKLLAATGIRTLFGPVIGNDMVERGKPDPQMGILAAAGLGVSVDRCSYTGDTVGDLRMAAAAGMTPIAVTYGVGFADELSPHAARLCRSFAEVVTALSVSEPTGVAGH
ncbi:HAD family hydrolase [Streptomyces niger]|uniref:HAD family hydrolase n=1 Tax=Streptomyces niger TaxID=66373 RepID=UPI000699656D|nr:HAD family hydrolase [Streptomyces niger]